VVSNFYFVQGLNDVQIDLNQKGRETRHLEEFSHKSIEANPVPKSTKSTAQKPSKKRLHVLPS